MPRSFAEVYKKLSNTNLSNKKLSDTKINWVLVGFTTTYISLVNIGYRTVPDGLKGDSFILLSILMVFGLWYYLDETHDKVSHLKKNALIVLGSLLMGGVLLWLMGAFLLSGIE